MIPELVAVLRRIDSDITDKDIADALWLALQIRKAVGRPEPDEIKPSDDRVTPPEAANKLLAKDKTSPLPEPPPSKRPARTPKPIPQSPRSGLYPGSSSESSDGQQLGALPFRSPAATALPGSLDIARTFRPFRKRVPQRTQFVLNEEATAKRIAEEDIWVPVLDYASTRWLDVALVIDKGASMTIWRQTIIELRRLLARHGAFRDVRLWELDTNDHERVRLYAGVGEGIQQRQPRRELELIDTSGRRLILVVTDCVSAAWHSGAMVDVLAKWGRYNPVTLLQVLPQRLWSRTALGMADSVRLHTPSPGAANTQLHVQAIQYWDDEETLPTVPVPIVTLEPAPLAAWSRAIARAEDIWIPGFELVIPSQAAVEQGQNGYALYEESVSIALSAAERVQRFRAYASEPARRLAGLLAMLPVTLPIIRLVQQAMLPEPRQVHVAEVFLSGLLKVISLHRETLDPDDVQYDFVDGVRENLLNFISPDDLDRVLTEITTFITSKFAHPLDFAALLANPLSKEGIVIDQENRPFALMGAKVLRRFGGEYIELADWLEKVSSQDQEQLTNLLLDTETSSLHGLPEQETTLVSSQMIEANDTEIEIPFERKTQETGDKLVSIQTEQQNFHILEPLKSSNTGKLLVITAGTIAAGVGEEFSKQIATHKASELQVLVRYLDTAHLPTRYPHILDGEWTQMTIDPQYIDTVRRNPQSYPYLRNLLYRGLLPTIQGSGGGSIRYNAAGAIAINRDRIKRWLKASITHLIASDKGQVDLSVAIVISAVGATGSGTLERLIDIIVETAQDANLPEPLHCDVFVLQPGNDVTDLGQANTLALYAEVAATRLSQNNVSIKSYRGRTIMVGWGSQSLMGSIDQLKEAAATLIRVTHDPSTDIAAEFQEREVDNHVLRQQDIQTGLPSHLSSATAITISLGNLEEKIIQRDAARLIDNLVFGGIATETTSGEYVVTNTANRQANVLLAILSSFLGGENPTIRYRLLLQRLRESVNTRSLQLTAAQLAQTPNVKEQASTLRSMWQSDKGELTKLGRQKIRERGANLAANAINTMLRTRRDQMGTGLSLKELRDDYLELQSLLAAILKVAQEAEQSGSRQVANDDEDIVRRLEALERANRFNRQSALEQALAAVQNDLRNEQRREVTPIATEVLKELERHVAESLRNLNLVLQKLNRQRRANLIWASADKPLRIDIDHPLHMTALTEDEEIRKYADKVSIFEAASRAKTTSVGRLMAGEEEDIDSIAEFRKWMEDTKLLDALFKGDIDLLLELALTFARKYIHKEVEKTSVIEVILETDEGILLQRLKGAAAKAHSLVSFSERFAPDNRQARLVSAYYDKDEERAALLSAINKAFGQGNCQLVKSKDRTEIVVFYYVDGLPMSAINDLTGRCLNAFLRRRRAWERQSKLTDNALEIDSLGKQRVSVPVYSGRDAEQRVIEAGVIRQLYNVRGQMVEEYKSEEIPELAGDEGTYRRNTT